MLDPSILQKIQASFAAQTMMQTLEAKLISAACGQVHVESPIVAGARQQQGVGHAGLTFSLGDSAAGYAALSVMPAEAEVMTAEIKINLLAPAKGQRLIAIGKVIKPGRRLVIVQADVYAVDNGVQSHIALLQGTMVPVVL